MCFVRYCWLFGCGWFVLLVSFWFVCVGLVLIWLTCACGVVLLFVLFSFTVGNSILIWTLCCLALFDCLVVALVGAWIRLLSAVGLHLLFWWVFVAVGWLLFYWFGCCGWGLCCRIEAAVFG